MLVGGEVPLYLLRPQRNEHGVPQQEPRARVPRTHRAGGAAWMPRLPGSGQHPRSPVRTGAAPRLRDAGYDLSLFYEVKANIKREQVALLRAGGVDWIQPGIETLSTPILRLMRKGVTAFHNIRLLKWCAEYGIRVSWNVIYGFPGEPPEEYARMADVVPSLTHLPAPSFYPLALHRFSPYHERPHEWGLEVVGPLPYYRFIYPVGAATLRDLAYTFEYRHSDGRDPETYVEPLRRAIGHWDAHSDAGFRSLRLRRGPGFIVIHDRRPGLEAAEYMFEDLEARIYLACDDGATAAEARAALGPVGTADLGADDVRGSS